MRGIKELRGGDKDLYEVTVGRDFVGRTGTFKAMLRNRTDVTV